MGEIVNAIQWINDTSFSGAVRDSFWVFPSIETVHVLAIVIVLGSITRLDMRLMGLVWRDRPVTEVCGEMLPWTWTGFTIAVVFGLMLWASKPFDYFGVAFFDAKMLLILFAGINMLLFQFGVYKSVDRWDRDPIPPVAARIAGGVSMAFWLCVVVCGRLIGFV